MKQFAPKLLTCALILISISSAFSQTRQPEKRFTDAGGGYSFAAPAGFNGKQNDEGFGLVNSAQTILIAVKSHDFQTFEKFAAQSNLEADGFAPIGKVQDVGEKGKTFRVSKQTPQGVLIVDTFVMFSPFSGGTLIVAFSDTANNKEGFQTALQIANSLAFTTPAAEAADPWQTFFSGKHLIYLYTSGGFSERRDIYLCRSSRFVSRGDSSSLSNNGSGAVASNSDGNWKTSSRGGAKLILEYRNGAVREYRISRRQATNEIDLNGNRYFIETVNQCP